MITGVCEVTADVRKITAKYQGYCRIKTVIKNQEVDIMKRRKNILAVLLTVTVMATAMPGSAIAAPVDGQTTEVSAKAGTEKAEKKSRSV